MSKNKKKKRMTRAEKEAAHGKTKNPPSKYGKKIANRRKEIAEESEEPFEAEPGNRYSSFVDLSNNKKRSDA